MMPTETPPSSPVPTPVSDPVMVKTGWFEMIKSQLNQLWAKILESKESLAYVALYFGLGFISAFLLRRFSFFFIMLIVVGAFFVILQQFDFIAITIHWPKVYHWFGMQTMPPDDNILLSFWDWIKTHIMLVISFIVGFLIGLRFS